MSLLAEKKTDSGRQPSQLQRFFILCSGADKDIIIDCPTEWNKFSGIGATIFLTACLAALSGGYAINFVFENAIVATIFGIFWAIVIFNLDRYIVLSLRKEKIPTTTDIQRETDTAKKEQLLTERRRLLWNQTLMASPRFVIAIIIAITVSKPIELRLFNNSIEKELQRGIKTQDSLFNDGESKRVAALNQQLTETNKQEEDDKTALFNNNPIYQDAKTKIPKLASSINEKENNIIENKKIINSNQYKELRYRTRLDPVTNVPYRESYAVWLPNAKALAKIRENKSLELEKQQDIVELNNQKRKKDEVETTLSDQAKEVSNKYRQGKDNFSMQVTHLNQTFAGRKSNWIDANKKSDDLPSRLQALGNISPSWSSVWWASMVITLLFLVLETAPVMVKLLTKRGPYDEKLDALEYSIYLEENRKIDELNRNVNELILKANEIAKLSGEKYIEIKKIELDEQLAQNKKIVNKVLTHQEELAQIYIDHWYAEEKTKAQLQIKGFLQQNYSQITLTDVFWQKKDSMGKIEYYFRNGAQRDNEVLCFENDQLKKGQWSYQNSGKELEIELLNDTINYQIIELTVNNLKLKNIIGNDLLELQRI